MFFSSDRTHFEYESSSEASVTNHRETWGSETERKTLNKRGRPERKLGVRKHKTHRSQDKLHFHHTFPQESPTLCNTLHMCVHIHVPYKDLNFYLVLIN